jgi:hypothetical protein
MNREGGNGWLSSSTHHEETDQKIVGKQPRLCPMSQRARCSLATSGMLGGEERTMRAYLETVAMIAGLLGTYFALLPLHLMIG